MSRLNHYACNEVHDPPKKGEGRPWPGFHRPGCQTADGHDLGRKISACRACAREYQSRGWVAPENPIRAKPKVRRRNPSHPHYACSLPPEEHEVRRSVGRDHRTGCAVAPGHSPITGVARCPACSAARLRKTYRTRLLKRYGMTVAEYDEMLSSQGGGCAVCGRRPDGRRRLAVDHEHGTGRPRGLLCTRCNRGIGLFEDDPALLAHAASYLT